MSNVTEMARVVAICIQHHDGPRTLLEVPVERRRASMRLSELATQYNGKGQVYAARALPANGSWVVDKTAIINIPFEKPT